MNPTSAYHPNNPVSSPTFVDGTPEWIKPMIQQASQTYNIPSALLSALLKQESGFNPNAKSPVGAIGIAQFMPGTAQGMGVDPTDPASSINGAAKYLRQSWDKFGKPELALAAYNAGSGAVSQYGGIPPYKETQNYVKNIMGMAGDIHQSANGPLLDMQKNMQEQSASGQQLNSVLNQAIPATVQGSPLNAPPPNQGMTPNATLIPTQMPKPNFTNPTVTPGQVTPFQAAPFRPASQPQQQSNPTPAYTGGLANAVNSFNQ